MTSPVPAGPIPAAAIRSAALMLDHLGEASAAEKVTQAVADFIHSQPEPTMSTAAIGDAIAERL